MKKYAIAPEGVEKYSSYLTPGKKYEALFEYPMDSRFGIIDDEGDILICLRNYCNHLPIGTNWTFIEEP